MKFFFVTFLAFLPVLTWAQTEVLRFKKCYTLFTRDPLPFSDPLLVKVKAGTLSGTDACMMLFDRGQLGTNDQVATDEGIKILKTFHALHQSFLTTPDYVATLPRDDAATMDIIDTNEAIYHLDYVLLKKNEPYKNLVTRQSSLKAIRKGLGEKRTQRLFDGDAFNFRAGDIGLREDTNFRWTPSFVTPTGTLIGITPLQAQNPSPTVTGKLEYYNGADMNRHFGAGMIGSQGYLMANIPVTPQEYVDHSDGALKVHRRWGKNVVSDLLCRDIPVLRSSDVISDVDMSSTIPFRRGISCMKCHSTIDTMAGSLRNVSRIVTGKGFQDITIVKYFAEFHPTLGSVPFPSAKENKDFYKSSPEAQLRYRSFDGSLVSLDVSDLQGLGQAIAEEDDLYACAAKRYFKFLTGIDSDLSDLGDLNATELSQGQMSVRRLVIQKGRELKSHQSLRSLIKSIISSPVFLNPSQGVSE